LLLLPPPVNTVPDDDDDDDITSSSPILHHNHHHHNSNNNTNNTSNATPNSYLETIVDFGGGTGHLSIPLALLFPSIRIICVDLGRHSLNLLHQKAFQCYSSTRSDSATAATATDCDCDSSVNINGDKHETYPPHQEMEQVLRVTSIPNLYTYYGPVHTFVDHPFDIAIALHLCGEATDVVLELAGRKRTKAIIVAPCCVGKLSAKSHNPYIYLATGSNGPTIQYPRSNQFRNVIQHVDDWNALAEAADYGDTPTINTEQQNDQISTVDVPDDNHTTKQNGTHLSLRKVAKSLLETDRCYYLQETFGYTTLLTQMEPNDASPKNDIIVAWLSQEYPNCDMASYWHKNEDNTIPTTLGTIDIDSNQEKYKDTNLCLTKDWTKNEEDMIRHQLQDFINNAYFGTDNSDATTSERNNSATTLLRNQNSTLVFPTGMGSRRRKLIHYIVTTEFQDQLKHWSVGKKNAEKTVAVAIKKTMELL
jgi:hypothetical protein